MADPKNIERVIEECVKVYRIDISESRRYFYEDYIRRRIDEYVSKDPHFSIMKDFRAGKKIDYPLLDMMVDKTYLMGVMSGKVPVRKNVCDGKTFIRDKEDLPVMRGNSPDRTISDAYARVSNRKQTVKRRNMNAFKTYVQSYKDVLAEIGEDDLIKERWGRKINPKADIYGITARKRKSMIEISPYDPEIGDFKA